MKNEYASTARGSKSGGKPREAEGDEDETETIDMIQKASATNNMHDLQPITADKDFLKPLFEIVLEMKTGGKTEPASPATGSQMKTAPIDQSPSKRRRIPDQTCKKR